MIRDLVALNVQRRFPDAMEVPHATEWLTDNEAPHTAHETRTFAASLAARADGRQAYSPESNGMAESLVKTPRRDYVHLARPRRRFRI